MKHLTKLLTIISVVFMTITALAATRTVIPGGTTGNKKLTANWSIITYSITYNLNGGTMSSQPTNYNIESNIILPDPTRGAYNFTGWTVSGATYSGEGSNLSGGVIKNTAGNLTFTANWIFKDELGARVLANGKTYVVVRKSMKWSEAKAYCENMGGHLATPKTQAELTALYKAIDSSGLNALWLGGTCDAPSKNTGKSAWHWIDGTSITYDNWNGGEPNNAGYNAGNAGSGESCMEIYYTGAAGKWNDLNDGNYSSVTGFVCEYSS